MISLCLALRDDAVIMWVLKVLLPDNAALRAHATQGSVTYPLVLCCKTLHSAASDDHSSADAPGFWERGLLFSFLLALYSMAGVMFAHNRVDSHAQLMVACFG